jgi:hypothetical protein
MTPFDDLADLADLAQRLRAAGATLAALAPRVEAGRPWPLSATFGVEPEASWGPPETLAHVAEMLPFWTGEIERVLDGREDVPVPFGRVAANALRIGVLERDRSLPPRELLARIETGVDRLARRLAELPPEAAHRRGVHPTLGELSVAEIAARFAVGHLEDHAEQLRATLGSA